MPAGYTVLPLTGIDGWQRDSRWFLYGFGLVPIMIKNHQEYTRTTNAEFSNRAFEKSAKVQKVQNKKIYDRIDRIDRLG